MESMTLNIKGLDCIIDEEDYFVVMRWNLAFARRNTPHPHLMFTSGPYAKQYLHRVLLKVTDKNTVVDHINGNTLDNRKSNLRLSNKSNNAANAVAHRNKESGLPKGVYKEREGFKAQIRVRNIDLYIGHFSTIEAANIAYISTANLYFGDHSVTNSRSETE